MNKKNNTSANSLKNQRNPSASSGVKRSLLSLEQRLMFDAAAAATASEVASEQVAQEQAEAVVSSEAGADGHTAEQQDSQEFLQAITTYSPGESATEVVFVDPTVPNYSELLGGMASNIEVIMLDGGQDGIEQMAVALSGRSGIDAIHVISHGDSGELQLGTGTLNTESMSGRYADELATIQRSLSDQADILVYGCDFAKGETGQAAMTLLAELTGADVQASSDLTGTIVLGGDWDLEVRTGTIETSLIVGYDAQMNWAGVLGTETVTDAFSAASYSNNDGTQSWSTSWSETDAGGGDALKGDLYVNSSELSIGTATVGNAISRGVDLSGATGAKLIFDYASKLTGKDCVEVRVSNDAGKTYQTLSDGVFSSQTNTGSGSVGFDLSEAMSADTRIQFIVTSTGVGERLYIDNVQVVYDVETVNSAPVVNSDGGGATASIRVTENTKIVTKVTATDADADPSLTYRIAGGADAVKFSIDSHSGELSFVSAPNFEAPADSGGNNIYDVTVEVSDSAGGVDRQAISAQVTNVNEAPTDLTLSVNTVRENAGTGTVVGKVTAVDADAGDTRTYSLTDTAGGRFAINATTGQLTVANGALLNYEAATSHAVTVRVTDRAGLSYHETFTINVTNVNEAPTNITVSNTTIAENAATGTVIGIAATTDPDAGGQHAYSLTNTAGGRFAIDSTTGQITVANGSLLNYEAAKSHSITVRTTDQGGLSRSQTFTIALTNVNEAPTDLTLSVNTVRENAGTGTVVGKVAAVDADAGDTRTYSLTDTAGGRFAINATTGQLTVANGALLNYEAATSHAVTVRVTDRAGLSYHETFTINVTNVNEAPTGADATVTIEEDTTHTLTPANFGFSDVDAGDRLSAVRIDSIPNAGTLTLSGTAVTAGQIISVGDLTAGRLVFTPGTDANGSGYASVTFSVRDSFNSFAGVPNTLTVLVTAVNDAPTDLNVVVSPVAENAATGMVVGTVSGIDPDGEDRATYRFIDNAGGRFAIDATTGQLTVANGALLNYEAATSHAVTVRVTDSGGLSVDKTFTIALTNVNEAQTGADATSAKDMAAVLTAAAFGSRSIGETSTPTSPALSLSSQVDADGFHPSDTIQNPIVLATETPLTMDIPASERAGDSEKFIENVVIQEKAERLSSPEETRESEGQSETSKAPPVVTVNADRRDLSEPGNAAENSDESIALQLSETVGLAGIASQSAVGAKTKLRALISRPAPGLTTSPDQTVQQPAGKDPASNPTASEQP